MPLIIIPAVCKEKGGPFGDPESCQKYGMGYVALSMAVSSSSSSSLSSSSSRFCNQYVS